MLKTELEQKAKLIELARALGQEPDPDLVAEVAAYLEFQAELRESVRSGLERDLFNALQDSKQQIQNFIKETAVLYPEPPSLDDLEKFITENTQEETHELVQETPQEIPTTSASSDTIAEQSLADLAAASISASIKRDSFQQPEPAASTDLVSLQRKVKYLEQWLGKISLAGPGGGASDTSNFTTYTTSLTANTYTVARKDYYIGVNYDGEVTITLPTGYIEPGRGLIIKDESSNCSLNPITISGNVDNDGYGFVLQIDNGSVQLLYHNGWRII